MDKIIINGARTHNLKNIDLEIPRDKFVIITGLSGSGKSSLAFDTLYAEGQRRYVESLSTYARQFLSIMEKPDVDRIEGLSPAIAIEQKSTSHNPRSTVGTVTEIYDYLRLLYARVGTAHCPEHNYPLVAKSTGSIADEIINKYNEENIWIISPVIRNRKGEHTQQLAQWKKEGYRRIRINNKITTLDNSITLNGKKINDIDLVIDNVTVSIEERQRIIESLDLASRLSEGLMIIHQNDKENEDLVLSNRMSCPECKYSVGHLEPRLFSFNSPIGACPKCDGIGIERKLDIEKIIRKDLSIQGGAIMGWNHEYPYYNQLICSILAHFNLSMDLYWDDLPSNVQETLLYGSGKKKIKVRHFSFWGQEEKEQCFEGFFNMLERKIKEPNQSNTHLINLLSTNNCPDCQGSRLNPIANAVTVCNSSIGKVTNLPISETLNWVKNLNLNNNQKQIAERILQELTSRLNFLNQVGLDYLSLSRSAETLSGGEAQRIRLATQIGSALVGVMYILDEPSIGLHQRDNEKLINTLKHLRDIGNTVIVVEHDEESMFESDYLIDVGPKAGVHGGEIICHGHISQIIDHPTSITAQYLSGKSEIKVLKERKQPTEKTLKLEGINYHNLKNVTVEIPIGLMVVITGVSGSGKSTLVNDTISPIVHKILGLAPPSSPPVISKISGHENFDKIIDINQSPIGRTPRSNPATYIGIFQAIRDLFAEMPLAKMRGYAPGRFSFNVTGGRCENCSGDGSIKVEMHFLADVYVTCDACHGKRYNKETLEVNYKNKNIADILDMTVDEAVSFFEKHPTLKRKIETLQEVGLGYIKLGQSATTLSGGEAQRIKLSRELSKKATGKTLYLLDEPTTGLHFYDIQLLLDVLITLRDNGNTIVIIEHNMDIIRWADWIIDMGPEGGKGGGEIIFSGKTEDLMLCKNSHTGHFLKKHITHLESKDKRN